MKKIVAVILTLTILLSLSPAALASDPPVQTYSAVPTEGTPANGSVGSAEGSVGSAKGSQMVTTSDDDGIAIITWRNSIEEHSSRYLKLYCLTISDMIADKLDNNYELQRWDGSSWVTISTSNNSITYTSFYGTNIYRSVSGGYYYRVKTVHKAWLGLYLSTKTLYSSYIYVS